MRKCHHFQTPHKGGIDTCRPMEQLSELCKTATAFSSTVDMDQLCRRIAWEACALLQFQRAVVLLLDDAGEYLQIRALSSPLLPVGVVDYQALRMPVRDHEADKLLGLRRPSYIDLREDIPEALQSLFTRSQHPFPNGMLVPLVNESGLLGMILLADPQQSSVLTLFDLDIATLLSRHASAAIANAQATRAVSIQTFETIARAKREWERTFDAIPDGIFIIDAACTITRVNKAFAAMMGKHPRDVVGMKCNQLTWRGGDPCVQCPILSMNPNADLEPLPLKRQYSAEGMILEIVAYPMTEAEGKPWTGTHVMVVRDVTAQERMQELIIRSEKLRVVGEMASGIAHDFNNLLASIIGWTDVMLLGALPPQGQAAAAAIRQAALDGAEIVKRSQEYTRIRRDTPLASVDVDEVVRWAIELARPRWKDWAEQAGISISLSTEFTATDPVRGSAADLREVFLNIILNAIDAMPEGGDINIRTGRQGNTVFVSIADSGIGMTEEVQRQLFDPFFTTKGPAGSGLGLSVAYGIVARHNGEIRGRSTLGHGSTFTVLLPVAPTGVLAMVPEAEEEEPAPQISQLSRKARILLIDDDERVLNATQAMLQSEDLSVTKCLGAERGIKALGEGAYDLVITDLGMSKLNGWEIAAKAKEISPETPVVLLTGWAAEIPPERLSESGVDGIIRKPCRLTTLRRTIDRILSGARALRESELPAEQDHECDDLLKILIIEDNEQLSAAVKERLQIEGHLVSRAASAKEGLRALQGERFDLALVDLQLPDMSGLTVAKTIMQMHHRPFVAMMTGHVAMLARSPSPGDGVDIVLAKPWKDVELQQVLDKARQGQRADQLVAGQPARDQ